MQDRVILETSSRWLNGPSDSRIDVYTKVIPVGKDDFDQILKKFVCEYAKYQTLPRLKKPFWIKHVDVGEWYKVRLSTETTFWVNSIESSEPPKKKVKLQQLGG